MKKEIITAAELAERVKVGDKLILEAEVGKIENEDESQPIKLLFRTDYYWPNGHCELTILSPEPEARVPQVGDVYEWVRNDSDKGAQWMQKEDCQQCIKSVGGVWEEGGIKDVEYLDFSNTVDWKFLYNIHDREKETAQGVQYPEKLEVGQYWHSLSWGNEWLIVTDLEKGEFECECTKANSSYKVGEKCVFELKHFTQNNFMLGRHPENRTDETYPDGKEWRTIAECKPCVGDLVECDWADGKEIIEFNGYGKNLSGLYKEDIRAFCRIYRRAIPATWQPKEGDTVWFEKTKTKAKVSFGTDGKRFAHWISEEDSINWVYLIDIPADLVPYTGQDAQKIDFSKAGQWITNGKVFVCTDGYEYKTDDGEYNFEAHQIGDSQKAYSSCQNWQPCTPEQLDLINKLQATLK